jgi:hypothetical protein
MKNIAINARARFVWCSHLHSTVTVRLYSMQHMRVIVFMLRRCVTFKRFLPWENRLTDAPTGNSLKLRFLFLIFLFWPVRGRRIA